MTYLREQPPPSVNGWGTALDREVRSIRRELDQIQDASLDQEHRIRSLEVGAASMLGIVDRVAMIEKALRAVVWAMAALCWKLAPDIAANLLSLLPVRIG